MDLDKWTTQRYGQSSKAKFICNLVLQLRLIENNFNNLLLLFKFGVVKSVFGLQFPLNGFVMLLKVFMATYLKMGGMQVRWWIAIDHIAEVNPFLSYKLNIEKN